MSVNVDAQTISAGQLFSTTNFRVPDFQRKYSWEKGSEVEEFWRDLSQNIDSPPYFLGLLIVTEEGNEKIIVDGQQRLITVTLLANALRKIAEQHGKSLVGNRIRDVFLYAIDWENSLRKHRLLLSNQHDKHELEMVIDHADSQKDFPKDGGKIVKAQRYLEEQLLREIEEHGDAVIGRWARFLTDGLIFTRFEHPDRNAAYKVFEVVNARGRDLTPAELIKSYLFSQTPQLSHEELNSRWTSLEETITGVSGGNQFTQFVRHVVITHVGYVIPRDLYEVITKNFRGQDGVRNFLSLLEGDLYLYCQMLDPSSEWDIDEELANVFRVVEETGIRTIRPAFMAMSYADQRTQGFKELIKIVVPRVVAGTFGTGSVESRFATAAREIRQTGRWESTLTDLADLKPDASEFEEKVATRTLNKGILFVLRSSIIYRDVVPPLEGSLHLVRPRNAVSWPGFTNEDFRILGNTIGNSIIIREDRRPHGANNFEGVVDKLLPQRIEGEASIFENVTGWSHQDVREINRELAASARGVWYEF